MVAMVAGGTAKGVPWAFTIRGINLKNQCAMLCSQISKTRNYKNETTQNYKQAHKYEPCDMLIRHISGEHLDQLCPQVGV